MAHYDGFILELSDIAEFLEQDFEFGGLNVVAVANYVTYEGYELFGTGDQYFHHNPSELG